MFLFFTEEVVEKRSCTGDELEVRLDGVEH